MVCCQAPVIVLFVPFVAEVAQDTAVGLPIDGFLLDVGVGIALLVPEGVFHSDVVRIEEVKTVVLLKALRGFVPFQHFFLGDATGVVVNVIVLQVAVQEYLLCIRTSKMKKFMPSSPDAAPWWLTEKP